MFTRENTRDYTDAELADLNAEWLRIVWDEKLEPHSDEYHARESQFADEVAKR